MLNHRTLALAAIAAMSVGYPGAGRGGFSVGRPASPEDRQRKCDEKLARAATALAAAEAKRARKAARRTG